MYIWLYFCMQVHVCRYNDFFLLNNLYRTRTIILIKIIIKKDYTTATTKPNSRSTEWSEKLLVYSLNNLLPQSFPFIVLLSVGRCHYSLCVMFISLHKIVLVPEFFLFFNCKNLVVCFNKKNSSHVWTRQNTGPSYFVKVHLSDCQAGKCTMKVFLEIILHVHYVLTLYVCMWFKWHVPEK